MESCKAHINVLQQELLQVVDVHCPFNLFRRSNGRARMSLVSRDPEYDPVHFRVDHLLLVLG